MEIRVHQEYAGIHFSSPQERTHSEKHIDSSIEPGEAIQWIQNLQLIASIVLKSGKTEQLHIATFQLSNRQHQIIYMPLG